MQPSGPSSRRRPAWVPGALLGLCFFGLCFFAVFVGGCVDKTPPPLWPTPPPPPRATPIGVPERPVTPAGGQGSEADDVAPPVEPEAAASEPEELAEQPGALGPWQPGRTHR